MKRALWLLVVLLGALLPAAGRAQTVGSERIVAVVGNDVILLSEVEEQTVIAASEAGIDPDDEGALAGLRRKVLDRMVDDLILVAAASQDDSVNVSENAVNEATEGELNEIRARFPSPADFEREIARSQWRTVDNYRKNLRRIKRRELLAQAYVSRHGSEMPTPPISDEEVRAYYEQNATRLGSKPATVRFQQLDLLVRPSPPALERAGTLADSLLGELRHGADFATLARQFSADSATARRGGDLGYFEKGTMMSAFEQAAFGIDSIGGLAGPVKTPFGFHIIRLEDRQGNEIRARHILIAPEISDADRAAARALGQALVDSLRAGADFDGLQARHADSPRATDEPVEAPLNQLPAEWQEALKDLALGGTTGLLTTPYGFAILELVERGGGGEYTFEELEPRIRAQLAQDKAQEAFVENLRKEIYVDVRWPEVAQAPPAPAAAASADSEVPPPVAADRGAPPEAVLPDSLPQVEGALPPGGAREAYVPTPEPEAEPAPLQPLENPPPLADTPVPDSLPSPPTLPPANEEGPPGRITPSGGEIDSTGRVEPPQP